MSQGGGFYFNEYHCTECGRKKRVSINRDSEMRTPQTAGKCHCGGSYSLDGLPRCFQCGSTDLEEGEIIEFYD